MSDHQDGVESIGLQDRAQWRGVLNTPFRNLFYANVTSSIGDWIGVAAILALTQQILGGATRGTAFALAGVMIARILPTMLLGPVAGVFVDRWDRRRLLIATDIGRGLVFLVIPFSPDIYALFLATLAVEVMATLFLPAKDAVVPQLVPRDQLVAANQLNLLAAYGTLPIGGIVAALFTGLSLSAAGDRWEFIAERPAAIPIWLNALTFFVSAVFVTRIPGLNSSERERTASAADDPARLGAWQELKQGFAFIASQPLVRGLVIGVMGAFLAAGAVIAVGQLFAYIVNAPDLGFYVLIAVVGTGLFAGILSVGPLSRRLEKEQLFAPGIATAGIALVVVALMPRLDLAAIPVFVMGYGGGLAFLAGYTILQERTSDAVRGRTFAAFNTGIRAALFASLVVVPILVGVIGPEAPGLVSEDGGAIGEGPIEPGEITGPIPYSIGGIRISLMIAGAVALAGAVYSGRGIHHVLSGTEALSFGDLAAGPPRPDRGLFVAFEGGDGAGKSTQVRLLRAAVERAGHDALVTREPGGTEISERLRAIVLDPAMADMSDRTEALVYAAARAQHVDEVIRPALDKGQVVLCDRFVDSSVVYQGVGRGLGEAPVAELNRWATGEVTPDLVVLLDVDPDEGMRRVGVEQDRLEGVGPDFHRTVNTAFRRLASQDPERYLVVDASQPADKVHARIREVVLGRLRLLDVEPPPPPAEAMGGSGTENEPAGEDEPAREAVPVTPEADDAPVEPLPPTERLEVDDDTEHA